MKYRLMFNAYDPSVQSVIAKVMVKEVATMKEVEEINERMLKERDLPTEQQSQETKFVKAVQDLIERRHGPRCAFALERIMMM